jgi:hypothetical protein
MMTYSEMIGPIRVFLNGRQPTLLERREEEDGILFERWLVQGSEIMIRIYPAGTWDIFVPLAQEQVPTAKITALERFLHGMRKDLEMLLEMSNLARTFLDRLQDLPACSDLDCQQENCRETRELRASINAFLARLQPSKKKEIA